MSLPAEMVQPVAFERWSPAMRGAYAKGWRAAGGGLSIQDCPYQDRRQHSGRLTWSRAFRAAWCEGWNAARQADPITAYYADRASSGLASRAR